ncbi:unnamed protein product [Heterobilharzia americana]|nr:unnamed protein product [Heterobilharzia americana]
MLLALISFIIVQQFLPSDPPEINEGIIDLVTFNCNAQATLAPLKGEKEIFSHIVEGESVPAFIKNVPITGTSRNGSNFPELIWIESSMKRMFHTEADKASYGSKVDTSVSAPRSMDEIFEGRGPIKEVQPIRVTIENEGN